MRLRYNGSGKRWAMDRFITTGGEADFPQEIADVLLLDDSWSTVEDTEEPELDPDAGEIVE